MAGAIHPQFLCSVCLDLMEEPVTISCGHTYCKSCITHCWNQEDQSEVYSCPQCRETFNPRPALAKNIILAEMVEKLKLKPAGIVLSGKCEDYKFQQKQMLESQREFQLRIRQREKDLYQLRDSVKSHKRSAQKAVEDSEQIFTGMIHSIRRRHDEVKQKIKDGTKAAVSEAEGIMEELQQEINGLRRNQEKIEKLLQTQDHITFMQCFSSSLAPLKSTTDPFITFSSFENLMHSIRQLRNNVEDFRFNFCHFNDVQLDVIKPICDGVTNTEHWSRCNFLGYSSRFTLDLNTVNKHLSLTERNGVKYTNTHHWYPAHPDRFSCCHQVLCKESVTACCYWELDWTGDVNISVSYKSIKRKRWSNECLFGCNDQSWSLRCTLSGYTFRHNNIETELPLSRSSRRIGVFVNHDEGTLSFYTVSETMTLIHSVQTTFTQPLYPGIGVERNSSANVCDV